MEAALELAPYVGVKAACDALGVARASFYREFKEDVKVPIERPPSHRALSQDERGVVMETLCTPRFVDCSPASILATLLGEGVYLCSESTMYRILRDSASVKERRAQRTHPEYVKPQLCATKPNEVWSWDITKLPGPQKWVGFYLYVIIDIYSRRVVGWMVANRENANLSGRLIEETTVRHGVEPEALILHSDRGSPMTAKCTAQLLADLGVTQSFSRPQVSDDNAISEAHFKTLKYHSKFPKRFRDIEHAIEFCREFFTWYNQQHKHSGIAHLSPDDVHFGKAEEILNTRQATLDVAYAAHAERFPRGAPKVKRLPQAVYINKPIEDEKTSEPGRQ